jgi:hypothetical protein
VAGLNTRNELKKDKSIVSMEKLKETLSLLLIPGLMLTCFSCGKEDVKIDPHKAILGKWEIIEDTFGPVEPYGYVEYLPDSVRIFYSYTDKSFTYEKYWLNDSILFISFVFIDQYDNDTTVFTWLYQFKFINYNRLQLQSRDPSSNPGSIYQRIK